MSGWVWIRSGAILGGLAVATGAFGAHSLKDRLQHLGTAAQFETAAQYHMVHALALVTVGLLAVMRQTGRAATVSAWSFLIGIIVFSGSLYALAVTGTKWLGAITPIGGVAFLVGWAALAIAASEPPGESSHSNPS